MSGGKFLSIVATILATSSDVLVSAKSLTVGGSQTVFAAALARQLSKHDSSIVHLGGVQSTSHFASVN
jgi:hypothetical protein